jgi:acyl-CoA synthetase (AMP-forming)/AMP-acid ligase II
MHNVALYLPKMARSMPEQPAVIVTTERDRRGKAIYARLSFSEMERLSNRYANALTRAGIQRGMRVLLMVKPGFEFIGLTFALLKMGAAPVLIDPGMGLDRLLDCIRGVQANAFVGIPVAQAVRAIKRRSFADIEHVVTVGRRWFWGGPTLAGLCRSASDEFEPAPTHPDEVAAILFTSGSTGPAKGVVYEHGMFDAQVRMIQTHYGIEAGEIDLPAFPLFALFSTAMGMTCVIPDMNPSKPALVNPARIVEAISDHHVTNTFGSPAMWTRVGRYCVENEIKLPTLRRILIAGAPVPQGVLECLAQVLDNSADVHTPYGATESLPVSSINGRALRSDCAEKTSSGAGTCVGKPMPGIDLRLIRITDEPIAEWSDDLLVPDGEYGEITVAGSVVTKEYFGLPRATALAKIRDGDRLWHRIGDIGYRDQDGSIWFCGRKSHRILAADGMMLTERCEPIFNAHPDVFRSALVGVGPAGAQTPVLIIEPMPGKYPRGARIQPMRQEILALGQKYEHTRAIEKVLFHCSLPVDIRHNAKINREELAVWAAERVR